MSTKISDLLERQIVNIADGKCLGNMKDIELNLKRSMIQSLILPGPGGLRGILQNQGELRIPWQNVVRIGIDVVLIDMPELVEEELHLSPKVRRKRKEEPAWQQEVSAYQREIQQGNVIVLPPEYPEGF